MPLKKRSKKLTANSHPVSEGPIIQTPDGSPMSLFDKAKLPMLTLQGNQFNWPSSLVVMSAKRVPVYEINPDTGWKLKDDSGNGVTTGQFEIRLRVADGDLAQDAVDRGNSLDGLNQIQCTIKKDVPVEKFVPEETLIELVKPNVMLGYGGNQVDRIVLVAEDYKEV